jgi:LPS-assembly lipoprotein
MIRHALPMKTGAGWRPAMLALLALLALQLAGCGFQLRGATVMPFKTLYAGFADASPLGSEFKRTLRANGGTTLVDKPEQAEARLNALSELREKEIVGFSSTGRPREYTLRYRFRFQLLDAKGNEVIPPTELMLRREVTTSDTELVAKQQEEVLLYREMQSDMVQQLMRRLSAAKI